MSRKSIYALTAVALGLSCLVSSAASAGHGAGGGSRPPPKNATVPKCIPCQNIHLRYPPNPNPPYSGGNTGNNAGYRSGLTIAVHY
jgi:hypothetical protein